MEMITVTFDEKGNPVIVVDGVKGQSCQEITRGLEGALGLVNWKTELKPENAERENENVRTA